MNIFHCKWTKFYSMLCSLGIMKIIFESYIVSSQCTRNSWIHDMPFIKIYFSSSNHAQMCKQSLKQPSVKRLNLLSSVIWQRYKLSLQLKNWKSFGTIMIYWYISIVIKNFILKTCTWIGTSNELLNQREGGWGKCRLYLLTF